MCDIEAGTSQDTSPKDFIPDECQGGSLMGGGGGESIGSSESMAPDQVDESDDWPDAALWAALDEWLYAQDFTGLTDAETLCLIEEKMLEVGIPVE